MNLNAGNCHDGTNMVAQNSDSLPLYRFDFDVYMEDAEPLVESKQSGRSAQKLGSGEFCQFA